MNATTTGVHTYDQRMPDLSAAAYATHNAQDRAALKALLALEQLPLSPRTRLDAKALELQLRDNLLQNEKMMLWRRQPSIYVDTASGAIFGLINRRFAPPKTRLRDVIARENAIPALFAQAKTNLTAVDATAAGIARDDARGLASFLAKDVPSAMHGVGDARLRSAFRASTTRATTASEDFARWLLPLTTHPTGTFAIGTANYLAMLRYEDAIDMPLPQYLAIGDRALHATRAQMVALAQRIGPKKTVPQVLKEISRRHPSAATLLAASQADLNKLRGFIIRHDIIALPPEKNIKAIETPVFERDTTVAAMDSPGPLETVATQAFYYVTPPDPRDTPAVREAYLEAFNDFGRPITSAHEVYPGHFVNFMLDRHLPLSLTEKLVGSNVFAEGWAHYCEQMIVDEGWGDGDPRVRLMQLKDAILREARYVVGVKLHTAGMTVPEAQHYFERAAFLDPADARIEAKRGTQDPLYGYYTLGKLEILKLRRDYKKKMKDQFTLAGFHAALLQYGDFPVPLIRPLLLGADDDGKVL